MGVLMAAQLTKKVEADKVTTQTISLVGRDREILIDKARENGRSLSAEIMYRVRQTLQEEMRA